MALKIGLRRSHYFARARSSVRLSLLQVPKPKYTQGVPFAHGLGWVDFNSECSTVCPIIPTYLAKRLGKMVGALGPKPCPRSHGTPFTVHKLQAQFESPKGPIEFRERESDRGNEIAAAINYRCATFPNSLAFHFSRPQGHRQHSYSGLLSSHHT